MSKVVKESGNKKHRILRAIFGISLTTVLAAAGVAAVSIFAGLSSIIIVGAAAVGLSAAAVALATAGSYKGINTVRTSRNKKVSQKSLQKIMYDDKTTTAEKVRLAKKYVKANLKLCKLGENPFSGLINSTSGLSSEKDTRRANQIDAYNVLLKLEGKTKKSNKISKTLEKIKTKLKLPAETCLKVAPEVVTQTKFIEGVGELSNREIEIRCHNKSVAEEFKRQVAEVIPDKDYGYSIIIKPNPKIDQPMSYVRISDKSKVNSMQKLLLQDLYMELDKKSELERKSMFPIAVNVLQTNKKNMTSKEVGGIVKTIDNFEQLKNFITTSGSKDLIVK